MSISKAIPQALVGQVRHRLLGSMLIGHQAGFAVTNMNNSLIGLTNCSIGCICGRRVFSMIFKTQAESWNICWQKQFND